MKLILALLLLHISVILKRKFRPKANSLKENFSFQMRWSIRSRPTISRTTLTSRSSVRQWLSTAEERLFLTYTCWHAVRTFTGKMQQVESFFGEENWRRKIFHLVSPPGESVLAPTGEHFIRLSTRTEPSPIQTTLRRTTCVWTTSELFS